LATARLAALQPPHAGPAAEWRAVQIGCLLSLAATALIAGRLLVVGSRWGNWVYAYVQPPGIQMLVVWASAVLVTLAALWASERAIHRHEWWVVSGWVAGGLAIQALLRTLTPFTLEQIFTSNGANAFYGVSVNVRLADVLSDFSRLRLTLPLHPRSNMPGKLMFVYAMELFTSRPLVLAWLTIAVSNAGGVLLYLFVREWLGGCRPALYALVLYLLVPGKLYFFPLLNTVTPTIAFAAAYPAVQWMRQPRLAYAIAAGVAIYGLVLFEPLPLVLALGLIVVAWRMRGPEPVPVRDLAIHAAALAASFLIVHVAVAWLTGFEAVPAFRELSAEAVAFNTLEHRRYLLWVVQNLIDFAIAIGVCQAVIFLAPLDRAVRRSLTGPLAAVWLALAVVVAVLDVAGVNRGEVVRLWIFLACLFQIPAACVCARFPGQTAISLVIASVILQDAVGTGMIGFVIPG